MYDLGSRCGLSVDNGKVVRNIILNTTRNRHLAPYIYD